MLIFSHYFSKKKKKRTHTLNAVALIYILYIIKNYEKYGKWKFFYQTHIVIWENTGVTMVNVQVFRILVILLSSVRLL